MTPSSSPAIGARQRRCQTFCRQRPVRPSSAPIATATRCRSMCPSFHMGGYVRQDHLDRHQDREGPCRPKDGCRASLSLSSRNQASLDHFQLTAPIHIDQRILKMTLRSDVVREVVGDVDQRCARHCWRSTQEPASDLVCLGLSTRSGPFSSRIPKVGPLAARSWRSQRRYALCASSPHGETRGTSPYPPSEDGSLFTHSSGKPVSPGALSNADLPPGRPCCGIARGDWDSTLLIVTREFSMSDGL